VFENSKDWVVLKFGGTSVSSVANWHNIARVLRERIAAGLKPVVVHSALSGITDRLEALLTAAMAGHHLAVLEQIDQRHRELAQKLSVVPGPQFDSFVDDLTRMANAIAETRELGDRVRARVMAMGELLATSLGASFLNSQGIDTAWLDAREFLRAERRHGTNEKAGLLSATCDFTPDARLQAHLRGLDRVVITQGFIAANDEGDTVVLGRGGSDTSGS
jgi:diaminopimelate decarboxylase/aspartate kinase